MPSPMDIPGAKAPSWVYIAGVIFGALTLLFLFGLIIYHAVTHDVSTPHLALLAPAVALGVALSAAFLGGAAAAEGNLGDKIQGYSLAFSAGGGVSVFVIVLFAFPFLFGQQPNEDKLVKLTLRAVPLDARVVPGNFWWQERRDEGAQGAVKLIDLLIDKDESEQTINVYKRPPEKGKECTDNQTDNQDVYSCSITANIFPDLHTLQGSLGGESSTTSRSHKSVKIISGTAIEFRKPELKDVGKYRNVKATDQACFYFNNSVVYGNIMIARAERTLLFNVSPGSDGVPLRPQFSPETGWWDSGSPASKSARSKDDNWVITSAFAQTPLPTPYDKLRIELSSPDPNVRVRARQFLGEHFDAYANDVLNDLKVKNNDPNLIVSLLHGLITGIDKKEGGQYLPKAGRDIGKTVHLPFLQGKEDDILDLVTIDDASVKKQVRRLVQRFPYDVFRDSFMRLFEKYHVKQDCEAKKQNDTNQSLIYAFSFFTYNQMVQIALNNPLSDKVIEKIEDIANQSKELAKCLDKALYIDSAIVDYGRATIYAQNKAFRDRTQAAANAFLDVVKKGRSNGAEYYFNSHIDTIERLVN